MQHVECVHAGGRRRRHQQRPRVVQLRTFLCLVLQVLGIGPGPRLHDHQRRICQVGRPRPQPEGRRPDIRASAQEIEGRPRDDELGGFHLLHVG